MSGAVTIEIYLPTGTPTGIRKIWNKTYSLEMLMVPRNRYGEDFMKKRVMNKSTLYFLVDSFGTSTQGRVYIGQTTDLLKRLDTHGKNKEFWDLALVFLTSNNSFNTAHIKYLEALCIEACKESGRYDVQQNSVRNFPVQQGLQAELDEYFRQISFYLRLVGYPMFDKVHLEVQEAITKLFCIHQLTETEAVGEYTDNGLVVLKGSTLVPTKSISDGTKLPSYMRRREELLDLIFDSTPVTARVCRPYFALQHKKPRSHRATFA